MTKRVFNMTTTPPVSYEVSEGHSFPLSPSLSASGTGYKLVVQGFERLAIQATGTTSAGTFSCVALIKVSLDDVGYITAGTITLNGASPQSDGFVITAPWPYVKASLSTIGGTNAVLNIKAGV